MSNTPNQDDTESTKQSGDAENITVEMVYCTTCGERIRENAEVCPECGVRQIKASSSSEKEPGIAALLSALIPGAGQMYNGQVLKGILLLILQGVNFFLIFVLIGFLTWPAVWLLSIWDAYKIAERINEGAEVDDFEMGF